MIKLPFIILLSGAFSLDGCLDKLAASSNRGIDAIIYYYYFIIIVPLFIQTAFFRLYSEYHLEAG